MLGRLEYGAGEELTPLPQTRILQQELLFGTLFSSMLTLLSFGQMQEKALQDAFYFP